jgi:RNA polymerase sigma factor (sigma-70 family)
MLSAPHTPLLRHFRQVTAAGELATWPDGALLRRFREDRNDNAFTALVRRHGPMVLAVCRRVLRDGQEAEDAMQATFLVLARKAGSLRRPEGLAAWLHGVAYRVARKARVGEARRKAREHAVGCPEAIEPPDDAVWRDLRPVLDAVIEGLPEKYREAVVLCYLQGRSNTEAARYLGCPSGTIASRLARARELLRGRLARRGLALSAGVLAVVLSKGTACAAISEGSPGLVAATVFSHASATSSAVGAAPVPAFGFLNIVLRIIFQSQFRGALGVLVGMGICVAGVEFVKQQFTGPARVEHNGHGALADKCLNVPVDIEAQILKALREKQSWKSTDGRHVLSAKKVEGRRLQQTVYRALDEQGRIAWRAYAKAGEIRVDQKARHVLLRLKRGEVHSEDGAQHGFFEEKTLTLTLPPDTSGQARQRQICDDHQSEAVRVLRAAFADDNELEKAAVKVLFRGDGLVLAADRITVEKAGQLRCAPCWVVRFGPTRPDGTRSVTAVRSREACLTLDRRVNTVAELAERRVINVEPSGDVRVTFAP